MILQKLKADAEGYLGEKVTEAVITVPAYFNDAQRQATKDAGKIAGLDVKRIINEPTAAALAYGLDNENEQKIMVYDLGGGTFDVSVIEIGDGVIEVLSTAGNNRLGGDDFDKKIMDYMVADFKGKTGIDLSNDKMAMERVKAEAEDAKKKLSSATQVEISIPFITANEQGPQHLNMTLTKAKFDELTRDLVERTAVPVQNALKDAGITAAELSKVLLVGGSTRIPAVQDKVKQLTGHEPSKKMNPDECVELSATINIKKKNQRAARLGRYVGKLDKLLGAGILVAHTKDGSGNLVAQIDFHALKAALGSVVIALTGNILLNPGNQMATRLNGRKLRPFVGALAAGGVAASGMGGSRQR